MAGRSSPSGATAREMKGRSAGWGCGVRSLAVVISLEKSATPSPAVPLTAMSPECLVMVNSTVGGPPLSLRDISPRGAGGELTTRVVITSPG